MDHKELERGLIAAAINQAIEICDEAATRHPGMLMQFMGSTARGEHLTFSRTYRRPGDDFCKLRMELRRELRAQHIVTVAETEDDQQLTVVLRPAVETFAVAADLLERIA
jgi:hypothetical protein